jgi:hypothetical protein
MTGGGYPGAGVDLGVALAEEVGMVELDGEGTVEFEAAVPVLVGLGVKKNFL